MISETYWKNLEDANQRLTPRFEKLQKRANGDKRGIQSAELDYFHALQHLFTAFRL